MVLPLLFGYKVLKDRADYRDKKVIREKEKLAEDQARQRADRKRALYAAAGVGIDEGTPLENLNEELLGVKNEFKVARLQQKFNRQEKEDQLVADISIGLVKMMAGL